MEQTFNKQREQEEAAKRAEKERVEQERLEQRKRQEMQRQTDLRRQENDRRRVQDSHPKDQPPPPPVLGGSTTSLTKSNSMAYPHHNRERRGSEAGIRRAESVKTVKTPKRTPSFNTRRRAGSFRKPNVDESALPPSDIQGFLERKHALIAGGKKAQNRSWKTFYSVLCGQLFCFFKNKDDFAINKASAPPVAILNARCIIADDYTKRKHTFKLILVDGSEFLFSATTDEEMTDWMNKISFHAGLEPSQQLLSYDTRKVRSLNISCNNFLILV